MKAWFAIPLWQRVITALILGVLTGWAWGPDAESIKWIGDFFIRSIKMLVVPLIFFSLVSGVAAIGDLRKLGAVGGRARLAISKRIFTILSESPRHLEASVAVVSEKKEVPHSVATAFASSVLPVPGGPNMSTPFHGLRMPWK